MYIVGKSAICSHCLSNIDEELFDSDKNVQQA
jgi:shikimate kinase